MESNSPTPPPKKKHTKRLVFLSKPPPPSTGLTAGAAVDKVDQVVDGQVSKGAEFASTAASTSAASGVAGAALALALPPPPLVLLATLGVGLPFDVGWGGGRYATSLISLWQQENQLPPLAP